MSTFRFAEVAKPIPRIGSTEPGQYYSSVLTALSTSTTSGLLLVFAGTGVDYFSINPQSSSELVLERTVDTTPILSRFAKWCALQSLVHWSPTPEIVAYLESDDIPGWDHTLLDTCTAASQWSQHAMSSTRYALRSATNFNTYSAAMSAYWAEYYGAARSRKAYAERFLENAEERIRSLLSL
jgi:hypothetical protein